MSRTPTTTLGPLGSTIHSLHAGPDTIAALAAVDWSRRFRRVSLDPVRGLVTLMAPSRRSTAAAGPENRGAARAAGGGPRPPRPYSAVRAGPGGAA